MASSFGKMPTTSHSSSFPSSRWCAYLCAPSQCKSPRKKSLPRITSRSTSRRLLAYYHISDPEKAVIVIENVYNAINQISQTTVRNVVGRFSLDQLLSDTASINLQIKNVIDGHTEPWGTQVSAVEIKDIMLPENMQRAMAKEAEAERERRAKIVAAEGEYQAAVRLGQAADIIAQHPVALQLRTLQTMAEISVEKNSTIIFPAQFMTTVQEAIATLSRDTAPR